MNLLKIVRFINGGIREKRRIQELFTVSEESEVHRVLVPMEVIGFLVREAVYETYYITDCGSLYHS